VAAWAALGPHAHPRRQVHRPFRARLPGRQPPRRPRTVVAYPARDGGHAAGAVTSRWPAPVPSAQPQRRALRTPPGLPVAQPVKRGRARTPPGPGPPPTPTDQRDRGSIARVRACSAVHRAAPRRGSPPGLDLSYGRVRTDGGGQQPAGHRTGGQQPAGRRTGGHQTAGHWTAGPPDPDDATAEGHHMVDADRRPTPWQASWPCRPRRPRPTAGCQLDAPPGSHRLATNQPGQLGSRDYRDGPGHRRDRQLQVLPRRPAGASAHCCPWTISGRA
jgi:hypothetical protein